MEDGGNGNSKVGLRKFRDCRRGRYTEVTMDDYADNRGIIADGVPETEEYMKEVLPNPEETENLKGIAGDCSRRNGTFFRVWDKKEQKFDFHLYKFCDQW